MKKVFLPLILVAIAGVGITVWGLGRDEYPRVILVGNPTEIPSGLVGKLPVGYGWIREEDFVFDVNTPDPDDPQALFILEEGITDMGEIMDWARRLKKKEIYFFTPTPIPHDVELVPFKLNLSSLNSKVSLLHNLLVSNALAHTVPPPTCTWGQLFPPGACYSYFNGSLKVCFMFYSRMCYSESMATHIAYNIRSIDHTPHQPNQTSSPASLVECMKAHNGSNFINYPVNLTVKVYRDCGDQEFWQTACRQSQPICGCAPQRNKQTPRVSLNETIYIASECGSRTCERNSWGVTRHELMHTYGYTHCDMDKNIDNSNHCIQGYTPATTCNNYQAQFLPPDHRYY
jgi:hypothetical protein